MRQRLFELLFYGEYLNCDFLIFDIRDHKFAVTFRFNNAEWNLDFGREADIVE